MNANELKNWSHFHNDDLVRMGWNTIEDEGFDSACILWAAYRWLGLEVL